MNKLFSHFLTVVLTLTLVVPVACAQKKDDYNLRKAYDASVVNSQSAPLLFGQSAMEKFGVITIDNQNNKLIIKR